MGTYNPNDFYPASGKEINSQGNVVTPADGINPDGSQNVQMTPLEGVLLASGTRTATTITSNLINTSAKGIILILNITAQSGTGGLQVQVRTIDPVSSQPIAINALPSAITTGGTYGYIIYPGASASAGSGSFAVQQYTPSVIGRTLNVKITHGDSSTYTYSLGYVLIP